MRVIDYSAELFTAGRFADRGWDVYFPHRDQGFDFIVTKTLADGTELLRPVQVKGKYPESVSSRTVYGYIGKLSRLHPEMVLVIPYYHPDLLGIPFFIAYMPRSQLRENSRGYRCVPAAFKAGGPVKRPAFAKFFDDNGLAALERLDWKTTVPDPLSGDPAD